MKRIIFSFIAGLGLIVCTNAQTFYVPGGTVGTSTNSNVGIGTNTPSEKLEIAGNILLTGTRPILIDRNTGSISINACSGGWTTGIWHLGSNGTNYGGWRAYGSSDVLNYYYVGASYSNPLMVVLPNGNLGLGTTNPLSKFSVTQAEETGVIEIRLGSNTASSRDAILRKDTTTPWYFDIIGAANATTDAGAIRFFTSDQESGEKMRLTSGGKLGVGTTSPLINFTSNLSTSVTSTSLSSILAKVTSTGDMSDGFGTGIAFAIQDIADVNNYIGNIHAVRDDADNSGKLLFRTYNEGNIVCGMVIDHIGQVGVGTTTPTTRLEVSGTLAAPSNIRIKNSGGTWTGNDEIGRYSFYTSDVSGIGVRELAAIEAVNDHGASASTASGALAFYTSAYNSPEVEAARITGTGNVLVGKTTQNNSAYKLDVEGIIRANEVIVNTTGADFVFAPEYKLPTLSEVEFFIKENNHLPDMAPASEMKERGMNVSEMQTRLLQKVEELTLYTIEQNNAIEELKQIVKAQNEKIVKLELASK